MMATHETHALDSVMTVTEVADEYDMHERGVRATCERGAIRCRQSGATWLILREDAEKRWGNANQTGCDQPQSVYTMGAMERSSSGLARDGNPD
jgi:hypothetical protein